MTNYYAAMVDKDGVIVDTRLLDSYTAVIGVHANALARETPSLAPRQYAYERHVLLDLSTVETQSEQEFHRLMDHDPVLRTIFDIGRRMGHNEGVAYAKGQAP